MVSRKTIGLASIGVWLLNWASGDILSTIIHSTAMTTYYTFVESHLGYVGAFGFGMLISAYWYDIANWISRKDQIIKRELMELSKKGIRDVLNAPLPQYPSVTEKKAYFDLEEKWAQEVEAVLKKHKLEDAVYEFGNLGAFPIQQFTLDQDVNQIKTMFNLHNDILKRLIRAYGNKNTSQES